MASAFQFGFGNPESYSDWAKYAGLDRKTGMFKETAQSPGIAPPETFSDLANQTVQGVKNTATGIVNQFSNAGSQLGQGNVMQAVNAFRPSTPVQPIQSPVVQPTVMPPVNYDFSGRLKNLENQ